MHTFTIALFAAALCGGVTSGGGQWKSAGVPFEKGKLYALSYTAKANGKGTLTGGIPGVNMDFSVSSGNTNATRNTFVFPALHDKAEVRLGTWNMPAGASWSGVELAKVNAEYKKHAGGLVLGAGETMDGNEYRFHRRGFNVQGPHTRPFAGRIGNAQFNSTRWRLHPAQGCLYEFSLKGRRFESFEVFLPVAHFTTGSVTVAVSPDGADWTDIATARNRNGCSGSAPAAMLPAERVFVRILGDPVCTLQAGFPSIVAKTDGPPLRSAGWTRYTDAKTGATVAEVREPDCYGEDWGGTLTPERVSGGARFGLWTADAEMRVAPWRGMPSGKAAAVAVSAAANEAEAAQLVVKAGGTPLRRVRVFAEGDLVPRGGGIPVPAAAVEVFQVSYVDVRHPTDATSSPGRWPDPLEPVPAEGVTVPPFENRPFWIRVKPPKGTVRGTYRGRLAVKCDSGTLAVPLEVEVFGFELPERMTLKTSFGCNRGRIYKYHNAKSAADRRSVNGRYLEALSAAHLSPYDPGSGIVPHWKCTLKENGGVEPHFEFDWKAWDEGMRKVLDEYRFNSFVFRIPGFMRQDFAKTPHRFHGREEGTPEYEKLAEKYLGAIEAHLKERGWIDMAGVYWFDEPERKDYPFLKRGLRAIRKYAPSIRCRITEQPEEELAEAVNLWCPVSKNLHSPAEAACRARGDEFWWYICMQPRAPYATLFIDHPGTDLRVWLWQTWQERISGILVWETTWWTSPSAYPDSLQNPYADAASWAATGQGPGALRVNWGNGDGRFLYPPRACFATAAGGSRTGEPVLDPPNGSIRLEILRDGIEDYEYFAILSRLDPGNPLLKVPEDVSRSLTSFTKRPEPLKRHRLAVARAIEAAAARRK